MQTIYIDISNKGVVPTIYAKQGDVGRTFSIILTDAGVPYNVPSGSVFSAWYSGKSGSGNYTDIGADSAFSVNENSVTVEMISQMLQIPGDGILCVVLSKSNGDQIGMWNIPYVCEEVPGYGSVAAEDYFTAFSQAVENLSYPDASLSVPGRAADAGAVGTALAGKAPAGFGLGEERSAMVVATDANLCVKNGWYALWSDTPNGIEAGCVMRVDAEDENNVIQTAFSGHYTNAGLISLQRKKFRGTWDAWEWVNPPMIPGAEYRTTERWDGKPVYTKLLSLGYVGAGYSSFTDGVSFGTRVIRSATTHGSESIPFQPAGGNIDNYEKQISVAPNSIHFYGGAAVSGAYLYVQAWYVKE